MRTALTNSIVPRGSQLPATSLSEPPFPTVASLPDRRSKVNVTSRGIRGVGSRGSRRAGGRGTSDRNIQGTEGENAAPRRSVNSEVSPQVNRSKGAKKDEGRGDKLQGRVQRQKMTVLPEQGHSDHDGSSNNKVNSTDNSLHNNNRAPGNQHNIDTSRKMLDSSTPHTQTSHITSDATNTAGDQIEEQGVKSDRELTADPPPIPPGVFLTSLTADDYPTYREPSPRPHHSQLTQPSLSASKTIATRDTFRLQCVYLEGLEHMQSHVLAVEETAQLINRQFHRVVDNCQDDWLTYLGECNQRLLQANVCLLKSGTPLQVVDSESRLVSMLNSLREDSLQDKDMLQFLTRFWEDIKSSTHDLQQLVDKFTCTVLDRLSNNYMMSHVSHLEVTFCQEYARDIQQFLGRIDTQLTNIKLLLKNYGSSGGKDLANNSQFAARLMVLCDLKAFPILGFASEICGKIVLLCETARQWLARDEQFMLEVDEFIRETRTMTRMREKVLVSEMKKQKSVEKNVKTACCILSKNREKLSRIEQDLMELEQKLNMCKEEQKLRLQEIYQKEAKVDFLKVIHQQTRRNSQLQSKRLKLLKQVKELGDYLKSMESDIETVQDEILAKSHEKILLTEKINRSEKSYRVLKSDLDRFSDNLEELEAEVRGLSGNLLQLEIVHTIRTSPEILDNLSDRPSSVKLSQSLRNRIKQRQLKAVTLN